MATAVTCPVGRASTGTTFDRLIMSEPARFDCVKSSGAVHAVRHFQTGRWGLREHRGLDTHAIVVWLTGARLVDCEINGERIDEMILHSGNCTIMPADTPARYTAPPMSGKVMSFFVQPQDFADMVEQAGGRLDDFVVKPGFDLRIPFFRQAASTYQAIMTTSPRPCGIALESLSLGIMAALARYAWPTGYKRSGTLQELTPVDLKLCRDFVMESLEEPLTLTDLANAIGLPRFQFLRAFRRTTGQTPFAYVRDIRAQHARHLLSETSLPLAEIAYACGYSSQQHFTKVFSDLHGIPPGGWRRQIG